MAQETDKTETANLGADASIAPQKVEKSKMAKRRDLVLGIAVFWRYWFQFGLLAPPWAPNLASWIGNSHLAL